MVDQADYVNSFGNKLIRVRHMEGLHCQPDSEKGIDDDHKAMEFQNRSCFLTPIWISIPFSFPSNEGEAHMLSELLIVEFEWRSYNTPAVWQWD